MVDYQYAYIVWCGIFAVVWAFLYWARRSTRREMLMMSFLIMPMGPIAEYFHVQDYWLPQTITGTVVGVEDLLIGFLIAGISASIYEWTYNVRSEPRVRPGAWLYLLFAYVAGITATVVGITYFGLTSMEVGLVLMGAFGLATIAVRPRLFRNALYSSIIFGTFLFLFYLLFLQLYPGIIDAWWVGDLSGTRLLGVPVEEVAWGFLWGFVAGPASELVARLKLPRWVKLEKLGVPRYIR